LVEIFDFVLGMLSILLCVLVINVYFGIFFERKECTPKVYFVWLVYLLRQLISLNGSFRPVVNIALNIILFVLIACVQFKGDLCQKVVYAVTLITFYLLIEFTTALILMYIDFYDNVDIAVGSIISNCCILIIMLVLKKFYKKESIRKLPFKYNLLLLLVPAGSIYILYNIFMLCFNNTYSIDQIMISFFLIFVINIIIFNLYLRLSEELQLRMKNVVYENQIILNSKYIIEKERIFNELRTSKHDMKHHLSTLIEILKRNDIDQAVGYIENIFEKNELKDYTFVDSGNIIVDSLINSKYAIAIANEIDFSGEIQVPVSLPYQATDLCIVLGNILDNALEASEKLPVGDRYIKLFVKYRMEELVIVCVNSFNGSIKLDESGLFITTKKDNDQHGIGIASVKKIAKKYAGNVLYECTDNEFMIKILLLKQ